MSYDNLGDRMKGYENVPQLSAIKRTPVIIRLDGKAFHTYTKHVVAQDPSVQRDPWSDIMHQLMVHTTHHLLTNIQGCVLAYTQSDEISLLLRDWDTLETDAWFDNNIQKLCSVSASMATMAFNSKAEHINKSNSNLTIGTNALFDSRVFNLPEAEVCNYFLWRQQDATRNSVQMLGRHYFSSKQMHGLKNNAVQQQLIESHGVNWNDLEVWKKRGMCVYREPATNDTQHDIVVDRIIPVFSQDRNYINRHLLTEEHTNG